MHKFLIQQVKPNGIIVNVLKASNNLMTFAHALRPFRHLVVEVLVVRAVEVPVAQSPQEQGPLELEALAEHHGLNFGLC